MRAGWRAVGALTLVALLEALGAACSPAAPAAAPAPPVSGAPAPSGPAAAAPAAPLETVRVAFAADAAVYTPMFIAIDKGYFAEEGLEIEIVKAGGGVSTPALISGDIQYSTSAASTLSAMLTGAPLRIVYTNADRTSYELWSATPDVRTLADLVGKPIGVNSRGDANEVATRLALQQHGVDPDSVSYVAVGIGAQRLGALQSGSVAAVALSVSDVAVLQEGGWSGGQRLVDIKNEVRMSWMGAATTERELRENRERVKRLLRATAKGREYFKAYRDEAIAIAMKYNDRPLAVNEVDYDETIGLMTDDGSMPVEVQQRDATVRAALNGIATVPPADQMYDYSVMREVHRELRASGWKPAR